MPYRKRRYKRRRKYGKKRSTRAIAFKALKIGKQLKAGVEHKFHDVVGSTTSLDFNGLLVDCNNIPIGTGDVSNRIGDKIFVTNMSVALYFEGVGQPIQWGGTVMRYKGLNTSASIADVYAYQGFAQAPVSPKTHDGRFLSKILFKTVKNTTAIMQTQNAFKRIRVMKSINFNAGGTTTIDNNALYLVLINDLAVAGGNVRWMIRLHYVDM